MPDRDLFSARLPREFFAGRPTSAPVAQVRDVIMCAAPDDISTHEFAAHPPIAGAYEAREQIGTPGPVELGRGVRIDRLSADDAELLVNACIPRGHYFKPIRHDNQRYSLIRDVDLEEAARHPFGWDEDRAIWDALTLSRLVRDTPHKLRHTFHSILVAIGKDPTYVMQQLGHTDPAFTLRVYAHVMRRSEDERERLRALVEGHVWAVNGQYAPDSAPPAESRTDS